MFHFQCYSNTIPPYSYLGVVLRPRATVKKSMVSLTAVEDDGLSLTAVEDDGLSGTLMVMTNEDTVAVI
jgi:hypothetical protein